MWKKTKQTENYSSSPHIHSVLSVDVTQICCSSHPQHTETQGSAENYIYIFIFLFSLNAHQLGSVSSSVTNYLIQDCCFRLYLHTNKTPSDAQASDDVRHGYHSDHSHGPSSSFLFTRLPDPLNLLRVRGTLHLSLIRAPANGAADFNGRSSTTGRPTELSYSSNVKH